MSEVDSAKVREEALAYQSDLKNENPSHFRTNILIDNATQLADEVERLRLKVDSEGAVLAMTVARLGGMVEGHPTARLNFLQRVDELRGIERENARLREALESYAEALVKAQSGSKV